MTHKILPIFLTAALVVAAGCGSDDDSESSDATASTTTAQSSSAPYGTYVRSMTKGDLARTASLRDEAGPHQETPPTGTYRLVIAKGAAQDVIKAVDPTDFPTAQDVTFEGDAAKISSYVNPAKGAFCGPEVPAAATYTFQVSGSTLVLKPKRPDPCADRDAILTGSWEKG
jgi:hypothetical protein